jgi:AbrB family looped-hinge helix DNA binding protein
MTTSLLSPRFQVVIPKEIRKSLNLQPGQRLQLVAKPGKIEIRPILSPGQLIGFLKGKVPIAFEREKTDRPLPRASSGWTYQAESRSPMKSPPRPSLPKIKLSILMSFAGRITLIRRI